MGLRNKAMRESWSGNQGNSEENPEPAVQCSLMHKQNENYALSSYIISRIYLKGTNLHFESPTAERRHILCVGNGEGQTHAARLGGAAYARFRQLG